MQVTVANARGVSEELLAAVIIHGYAHYGRRVTVTIGKGLVLNGIPERTIEIVEVTA
jgi:hypothetical protein